MTTNIDRAADVIYQALNGKYGDFSHHGETARRLADAGLLMPDLPEPHTFPSGEREWGTIDGFVNLHPDGTITAVYDRRDEDDVLAGVRIEAGELVFTSPSDARAIALALLAAADYAEGVGREGGNHE